MNRLKQLAINEEGFVFDPATGESFTVNKTGLLILKGLRDDKSSQEIAKELSEAFEVETSESERDAADFIDHLRTYKLL